MISSGMEKTAVDVRGGDDGGAAAQDIDLVRDLLDNELVDRRREPMGRVDGIILSVADGSPPRVVCIVSDMILAVERASRPLGRMSRAIARWWGVRRGRPVRIPWKKVVRVGLDTVLDMHVDETDERAWEHWLRDHIVHYLPSLKPKKKDDQQEHAREEFDPPPPAPPPVPGSKRVRLHWLLGREVVDSNGDRVGHFEEAHARIVAGQCLVQEYLLGQTGMLERLSIADLSMLPIRMLGGRRTAHGYHVPWDQMDLSNPKKPRLRCTCQQLRAVQSGK